MPDFTPASQKRRVQELLAQQQQDDQRRVAEREQQAQAQLNKQYPPGYQPPVQTPIARGQIPAGPGGPPPGLPVQPERPIGVPIQKPSPTPPPSGLFPPTQPPPPPAPPPGVPAQTAPVGVPVQPGVTPKAPQPGWQNPGAGLDMRALLGGMQPAQLAAPLAPTPAPQGQMPVDTSILEKQMFQKGLQAAGQPGAAPAPQGMQLQPRPTYDSAIEQLLNIKFGPQAPVNTWRNEADGSQTWHGLSTHDPREEFLKTLTMTPADQAREQYLLTQSFGPQAAGLAMDAAQAQRTMLGQLLGGDRQNDLGYSREGGQRLQTLLAAGNESEKNAIARQQLEWSRSPIGQIAQALTAAAQAGKPMDTVSIEGLKRGIGGIFNDPALRGAMQPKGVPGVPGPVPLPGVPVEEATAPPVDPSLAMSDALGSDIWSRVQAAPDGLEAYKAIYRAKGPAWLQKNQDLTRQYLGYRGLTKEAALEQNKRGAFDKAALGLIDLPLLGTAWATDKLFGSSQQMDQMVESMRVPTSQRFRRQLSPQDAAEQDYLEALFGGNPNAPNFGKVK